MDEPKEDDITRVIDFEYEPWRTRFSLDEKTPEEWEKEFGNAGMKDYYAQIYPDLAKLIGTTSRESFYESRRDDAKQTIRDCLILRSILEDNSPSADPTESKDAQQKLTQLFIDRLLDIIYGGK